MRNAIIISIILLLSISGCKKFSDNPVGPSESTGLFHLKIGDTETTIFKNYLINNAKDSLINQQENTGTILRDTVFGGYTWYSSSDKWYPDEQWDTNKDDGYWTAERQDDGSYHIFMGFKFPCSKGDAFNTWPDSNMTKVIGTDTTITVVAGTFKCIQYQHFSRLNKYVDNYFISPGIGMIKGIIESIYPSKIMYELKSYSFK